MKNKILLILALVMGTMILYSFVEDTQDPWPVPAKYEKMENPVDADKDCLSLGKSLYNQHCKSCHGKEGLGDGPKAAQLDTPSGDFTAESFTSQSDGTLFYKSVEGRDDMPSFKKKIPEADDMWCVIHYMRTFE
jgi:mono/diheme cytochrome c family protein